MSWRTSEGHRALLAARAHDLVAFFQYAAPDPDGGFGALDLDGAPLPTPVRDLVGQTRLTYSFALAHLMGRPGARELAEAGVAWLLDRHRDGAHGGYRWEVGTPGDDGKRAYGHAFVLLAAAAARMAGAGRAEELLDDAAGVLEERFWASPEGRYREDFTPGWEPVEAYRGQNSNMHLVEALLTAHDATGERLFLDRALAVAGHLIDDEARRHGWRVQEHHDEAWRPLPDYHRDQPFDVYRPYGTLPGHSWEWARLLVQLRAAAPEREWLLPAARELYAQAFTDAWWPGRAHPAYTIDAAGRPVVQDVVWWPVAEAIGAAAALAEATGEPGYEEDYVRLWAYADRWFVDHRRGGWYAVRTPEGEVSQHPWPGKPDLYHSLTAHLIPLAPTATSVAAGLAPLKRRSS
ncbi:MAG TPA: AGE family epimerase/isomerase [Pseudonocardia sp.]|nr:AGE family epimerase/isomerase [Pseudonocardia sp.]